MVRTAAPLNDRQRQVLDWIAEGCPAREWPNATYKATAIALQNRRLVKITKRGGWSAVLTESGEYYCAHGAFPVAAQWTRQQRAGAKSDARPRPTVSVVAVPRPRVAKSPDAVSQPTEEPGSPIDSPIDRQSSEDLDAARLLAADVAAANGELRRDVTGRKRYFARLVDIVNAEELEQAHRRLSIVNAGQDGEVVFTYGTVPTWLSGWPRHVVVAERIPRWHPVVVSVRTEKRLSCTAEVKPRALRILHLIATEADARGHKPALPRRDLDRNGYHRTYEHGHLKIAIRDYTYTVSVFQQNDRVEHVATSKELEEQKRYSWTKIPKWDSVPNGQLGINVCLLDGRDSHGFTDNPKRLIIVEDLLPEAMQWLERDADRRDAVKEAERIRAIAEVERQREAARLAEVQHRENLKADELRSQAGRWAEAAMIRTYLAALAERVAEVEDDVQRTTATEWLEWGRGYVEQLDPLAGVPGPPRHRSMTWEERLDLTAAARSSMS